MKVLLTTLVCIFIKVTMARASVTRCQLNNNTRFILNSIELKLRKLGVELDTTKDTIVNRWLKNNLYGSSDIPISAFTGPRNISKTTPEGTLETTRKILKVSIQHITKFKRQFGAFSVAKDVTHRLQKIKWEAGEIIYFIQRIQSVLLGSGQLSTVVVRPNISVVINATSSSRGVHTSTQSSAAAKQGLPQATALTLQGIALRASAMMEDLYTNLLEMQLDFEILAKTLCS